MSKSDQALEDLINRIKSQKDQKTGTAITNVLILQARDIRKLQEKDKKAFGLITDLAEAVAELSEYVKELSDEKGVRE